MPPPPKPEQPFTGVLVIVGVVALLAMTVVVAVGVLSRPPASEPVASRFVGTPPPTPGPADLLLERFWSVIGSPSLDYHEEVTGEVTSGDEHGSQAFSLDVHGDDYSGTVDIRTKGDPSPGHHVVLRSGGIFYTRDRATGPWTFAGNANQLELRAQPFLALDDLRQLAYGGTAIVDGVGLQRLLTTAAYSPSAERILPIILIDVPTVVIEGQILIEADGTPVKASFTCHVPADPANQMPALDGTATYVFTRVGEVAPIPTPSF